MMMMIGIEEGLTETSEEIEVGMEETEEIDVHGEEMAENRLVRSPLIFRMLRTSRGGQIPV